MNIENQSSDEMEIDLSKYVEVLVRRKMTFVVVFLLILAIGFVRIQFSPKLYKVSMLIQPPVSGEALSGADDIESAEALKGLIASGAFNEKVEEKLRSSVYSKIPGFSVDIFAKTNVLEVSVNLESKKKEFGITLLQGLSSVMVDSYAKRLDVEGFSVANQIRGNEQAIAKIKEEIKTLQDQIKIISSREQKLNEEISRVDINTAQILENRKALLQDKINADSVSRILLTNSLQNNLIFLNQMNNQLTDLSIRRSNLNRDIKNSEFRISDFQMIIDKLNRSNAFVSNLRIVSQPAVSLAPISLNKKKILALFIFMGLLCGIFMVFAQEFWQKNLKGKSNK